MALGGSPRMGLSCLLVGALLHGAAMWVQATKAEDLMEQADGYRKEGSVNPQNASNHIMLGIVLQQLHTIKPDGGRAVPEAEMAYRTALELPLDINVRLLALGNLGALLMSNSRAEEAVEEIDRALQLAEESGMDKSTVVGLLFNRSKALAMLGHGEKSHNSYAETIEAARFHDHSSYAKSVAAMDALPETIVEEIHCAAAYITGAPQTNCSFSDDFFYWVKNMPDIDKSWMFFGLWKSLCKSLPDSAWKYLDYANAIQKTMSDPYDRHTEDRGTKAIKDIFSRSLFEQRTGHDDPTPIFIVGLPRSGSTLIEQLLASHSDVLAIGEDTPLAPIVGELMQELNGPNVNQYKILKESGARVIHAMLKFASEDLPKPSRIVDKMLRNVWNIGYIHLILPKACIIHAERHPMDAGLSCYAQPFEGRGTRWAWNLVDIGHQYKVLHNLLQHWDNVLPNRVLTVHYEMLVSDFEREAKRIIQHCGLDWQDTILHFHETIRSVSTASMDQVRKKLYTSSVGKWRRFEQFLGPLREELGYLVTEYDQRLKQAHGTSPSYQDEL